MSSVKTRILILSDTHGKRFPGSPGRADVAIHCGDLTTGSKLSEFWATLEQLRAVSAPLKLVIAGNHDFTLDEPVFRQKVVEAHLTAEPALVAREYGGYGEVRALFEAARAQGVRLLDEGTHRFVLDNGAALTVYASPLTPSEGDWGFRYRPGDGHDFAVEPGTDVVVTHGPPVGILDRTGDLRRAGSADLFAAVARARPRLHCFGHIHEAWGAKLVAWRDTVSDVSSHFANVDNGRSVVVETLRSIGFRRGRFADKEAAQRLDQRATLYADQGFYATSHCADDEYGIVPGRSTLFVNAAVEGNDKHPFQPGWLVDLELPRHSTDEAGGGDAVATVDPNPTGTDGSEKRPSKRARRT